MSLAMIISQPGGPEVLKAVERESVPVPMKFVSDTK